MNDDLVENRTLGEVSGWLRFSSNFFVGCRQVIRADWLQAWMDSNRAIGTAPEFEGERHDS
jgi:hypothetical protein